MNAPFELDRSSAVFIATLEVWKRIARRCRRRNCDGFGLVSAVGERIGDLRKPSGPPVAWGVCHY
jgi:hypothetical protein